MDQHGGYPQLTIPTLLPGTLLTCPDLVSVSALFNYAHALLATIPDGIWTAADWL